MLYSEMNAYNEFIDFLLEKEIFFLFQKKYFDKKLRKRLDLQKHHIMPRHSGGTDDRSNIVICTAKDHASAHKIRFQVFHNFKDQAAYLFLQSLDKKGRIALGQAIAQTHKKNKTLFFDPLFQKELANRPKKSFFLRNNPKLAQKYASMSKGIQKTMTEAARKNYLERGQYVGKIWGSKGGLAHQNPVTRERLKGCLIWTHESGVSLKTKEIQSLRLVKDLLNQHVPDSVKHTSGLSELIRGIQKKRYNWSVQDEKLEK